MKRIIFAALLLALPAQAQDKPRTLLFIGNSFTFAEHSALKHWNTASVHDLNPPNAAGETIGGVPALFQAFATAAGLHYDISLETVPGKGLDYHLANKRALLDKPWDLVVMHGFSTLDIAHPGDPALLVQTVKQTADMLRAQNPKTEIWLTATWSRADQTYPADKPWHGKPIQQMGIDVAAGYAAAAQSAKVTGVVPVGLGWNRAIDTGLADGNPYDGIAAGKIDLWAWDQYHACTYGYFLEALLVFGRLTGRDPLSVGHTLPVVDDMGLDPKVVDGLEQIAHDQLAASNQLGQ
jgi:hypothetical protein